ncbi:hypothetical protein VTG60DRAFT_4077 [Thermothelomyces hinnuleus]
MADSRNRERGLRAAINNPRVSEEAKQHDRELLESEFGEHIEPSQPAEQQPRRSSAGSGKKSSSTGPHSHPHSASAQQQGGPPSSTGTDKGHPTGGRKARRASIGEPGAGDTGGGTSGLQQMADEKERGNVIRGLKAALKNPHVSEQAKEVDREKLRALGETVE